MKDASKKSRIFQTPTIPAQFVEKESLIFFPHLR
jgi:hypothetical protein